MTKLYRVDLTIHATAYVRAVSEADAVNISQQYDGEATEDNFKEITSEQRFDDPNLPEFSISPAMTLEVSDPGAGIEEVTD